jgi:hypothetical protein
VCLTNTHRAKMSDIRRRTRDGSNQVPDQIAGLWCGRLAKAGTYHRPGCPLCQCGQHTTSARFIKRKIAP